jgi:uroporphyrinogen-III synthase
MAQLDGRRLLVTRSAEDAASWVESLTAAGAKAIVLPCIETQAIDDPALAERLATSIGDADWLVFTSRRGVEACARLVGRRLPPALQIAAVGEATGALARARFGRIDRIGHGTAAVLGRELAELPSIRAGARCVLALAENAGDGLERALGAAGASVVRHDVYRTLPAAPVEPKTPLSSLGCDTILFASPSAVTGFANQVNVDLGAQIVTIGPSTSAAVRAHGWEVAAEAREPSLSAIIESVMETRNV